MNVDRERCQGKEVVNCRSTVQGGNASAGCGVRPATEIILRQNRDNSRFIRKFLSSALVPQENLKGMSRSLTLCDSFVDNLVII
jgi:hypothetical protein